MHVILIFLIAGFIAFNVGQNCAESLDDSCPAEWDDFGKR